MATKLASSARSGFYGGTHGNMATAVGLHTAGAAANDEIILGKLPAGLVIKKIGAGCKAAAVGVTVDVKCRNEAGTVVTLASGLSVNATFTVKDIYPVASGFEEFEVFAVVLGGALSQDLTVTVEYLTVGTQ